MQGVTRFGARLVVEGGSSILLTVQRLPIAVQGANGRNLNRLWLIMYFVIACHDWELLHRHQNRSLLRSDQLQSGSESGYMLSFALHAVLPRSTNVKWCLPGART